jgi:hypothetical protein
MFGKFLVHAWNQCGDLSEEHFFIGSLKAELILACPRGAQMSLAFNEPILKLHTDSKHAPKNYCM